MFVHLTAHVQTERDLCRPAAFGFELWAHLRSGWPNALAACLMPNHLHLLTDTPDPEQERYKLARVLGALTRGAGRGAWRPVRVLEPIADRKTLARVVRYVVLNAPRAGLVSDPLEWPWSTHRGVVGAEVNPWVSAHALARALAERLDGFSQRFHGYVSGQSERERRRLGVPLDGASPNGTRRALGRDTPRSARRDAVVRGKRASQSADRARKPPGLDRRQCHRGGVWHHCPRGASTSRRCRAASARLDVLGGLPAPARCAPIDAEAPRRVGLVLTTVTPLRSIWRTQSAPRFARGRP